MALQGVASISYAGQRPSEGWQGRSSEKEGCGRVLESKDNRRLATEKQSDGGPFTAMAKNGWLLSARQSNGKVVRRRHRKAEARQR